MKRYTVKYNSNTRYYDSIKEFKNEIYYFKSYDCYYCKVTIFDTKIEDFIFYKDVLTNNPEIDLITTRDGDLRTTNDHKKNR